MAAQIVHSVWIINRAGGLIYDKSYTNDLPALTANESLIAAGTFHGIDAIASRISPVAGSSGVEVVESDAFKLTCFKTPTGIKLILLTSPTHNHAEAVLKRVYEAYSTYLQNPFYNTDMPLRGEMFDQRMAAAIKG